MISFKQFLEAKQPIDKWEDMIHHMAEEELVACKVFEVSLSSMVKGNATINIIADCNDDPRKSGYQKDLSEKLTNRLAKHNLPGLGKITAKVYHKNIDTR